MREKSLVILFIIFSIFRINCYGNTLINIKDPVIYPQELRTYQDSQILFNGRIWQKKSRKIIGHEFLFSPLWLKGDVIIDGHHFTDRFIRYDIWNDELLLRRNDGLIFVLNKELTSGFSLKVGNINYNFENFGINVKNQDIGYARVLYRGKTALLLKSVKEIEPLGYMKIYDLFYLTEYPYIMKDGNFFRVRGEKGLLDFLNDKRDELKNFIRKNRILISPKQPENIIPLLKFYDSLAD